MSEQDQLAILIRDGNLAAVLATSSASACCIADTVLLPMIPILSGIIVGQGEKVQPRAVSPRIHYVQGMALTYARCRRGFVLAFKQAPQAFFNSLDHHAFRCSVRGIGTSPFRAYTLQMPSRIANPPDRCQQPAEAGSYVGCFVMVHYLPSSSRLASRLH